MKVKTFEASDIQEALRRVKREMGPGAVIVSTRHIRRRGLPFGIFGRPHVEITAALPGEDSRPGPEGGDLPSAVGEDFERLAGVEFRAIPDEEANGSEGRAATEVGGSAGVSVCPAGEQLIRAVDDLRSSMEERVERGGMGGAGGVDELRWEMEELRWTVNAMLERMDPLKGRGLPAGLSRLYKRLRLQGVRQDLALKLLESVKEVLDKRGIRKPMTLEKLVEDRMVSMMPPPPEPSGSSKRRMVALIGPAGSGKTTTLAKLAADAALKKRKRVVLISMDTFRIGAVEQLRIYAKAIGIPLRTAGTSQELVRVVAREKEADFLFIDTTGRSLQDPDQDAELRRHLRGIRDLETHLVLNATAKDRDLWNSIRRFWPVPIRALLFTRLDETKELGTLFNQAVRSRRPLSYFSTGQRVPEDLEVADPRRLARMLLFNPPDSSS